MVEYVLNRSPSALRSTPCLVTSITMVASRSELVSSPSLLRTECVFTNWPYSNIASPAISRIVVNICLSFLFMFESKLNGGGEWESNPPWNFLTLDFALKIHFFRLFEFLLGSLLGILSTIIISYSPVFNREKSQLYLLLSTVLKSF